jgi:hypothetical protein
MMLGENIACMVILALKSVAPGRAQHPTEDILYAYHPFHGG